MDDDTEEEGDHGDEGGEGGEGFQQSAYYCYGADGGGDGGGGGGGCIDLSHMDKHGRSVLIMAAKQGQLGETRRMLRWARGKDREGEQEGGRGEGKGEGGGDGDGNGGGDGDNSDVSVLSRAGAGAGGASARGGHLESSIMRSMLLATDVSGNTALHHACMGGHTAVAEVLVRVAGSLHSFGGPSITRGSVSESPSTSSSESVGSAGLVGGCSGEGSGEGRGGGAGAGGGGGGGDGGGRGEDGGGAIGGRGQLTREKATPSTTLKLLLAENKFGRTPDLLALKQGHHQLYRWIFSIETGFSVTTDLPDFAAVPLWCSANKKELPHWIKVRREGRERKRGA